MEAGDFDVGGSAYVDAVGVGAVAGGCYVELGYVEEGALLDADMKSLAVDERQVGHGRIAHLQQPQRLHANMKFEKK